MADSAICIGVNDSLQIALGLDPGHGVPVHVLAIPEGEAAVCTLHLEAELLVEGDSYGV